MKQKDKLPTVSVIVTTFNSQRTIRRCLGAVRKQDYPQKNIEILVVDGRSTDKTLEIAKNFNVRIINVPNDKQGAEYNKAVGVNSARNELLLLLDHDNILPHMKWLRKMVRPMVIHKELVGVEPLRFHYDPKMTLLDRYFALMGGSDPVPYYFGKNSHLSWAFDKYNLWGEAKDMGEYYLIKFSPGKVPSLGANGALLRRKLLLKEAKADLEHFFHIDVHVDLIRKGFNTYAMTKDTIIHLTNNKLFPFLLRRKYYIEKYHFQDFSLRRFSVYEPVKDRLNLIKYVLISVTIIVPLFDAIRGFIKIRDVAWFIHPLMCFGMLIVYGFPTLKEEIKRVFLAK